MIIDRKRIVFVVGNDVQLRNAKSVCRFLDSSEYQFFDLWTARFEAEPPVFSSHTPALTATRILASLKRNQNLKGHVFVLPQDVGLLQRLASRRAKRAGAKVVLMPDGVVSSDSVPNGNLVRRAFRRFLDLILRSAGLVEGRAGDMGSSQPHMIFSWGQGWDNAFGDLAGTEIVHMGCPRMDDLADLGKNAHQPERRILICSQPLSIPSWAKPYAADWYSFLERALEVSKNGFNVRVRLHPAERNDSLIPSAIVEAQGWGPLREDIEWSTVVMAPFSTVLVEALAAHRPIVALTATPEFSAHASKYPFFKDARVEERLWNIQSLNHTSREDRDLSGLRNDFVAFAGSSSERIARALKQMVEA